MQFKVLSWLFVLALICVRAASAFPSNTLAEMVAPGVVPFADPRIARHMMFGRRKRALSLAEQTIRPDGDSSLATTVLAHRMLQASRVLASLGRLERALNYTDEALQIITAAEEARGPEKTLEHGQRMLSSAHTLRGMVLWEMGEADGAEAALEKAVDVARTLAIPKLYLAAVQWQRGGNLTSVVDHQRDLFVETERKRHAGSGNRSDGCVSFDCWGDLEPSAAAFHLGASLYQLGYAGAAAELGRRAADEIQRVAVADEDGDRVVLEEIREALIRRVRLATEAPPGVQAASGMLVAARASDVFGLSWAGSPLPVGSEGLETLWEEGGGVDEEEEGEEEEGEDGERARVCVDWESAVSVEVSKGSSGHRRVLLARIGHGACLVGAGEYRTASSVLLDSSLDDLEDRLEIFRGLWLSRAYLGSGNHSLALEWGRETSELALEVGGKGFVLHGAALVTAAKAEYAFESAAGNLCGSKSRNNGGGGGGVMCRAVAHREAARVALPTLTSAVRRLRLGDEHGADVRSAKRTHAWWRLVAFRSATMTEDEWAMTSLARRRPLAHRSLFVNVVENMVAAKTMRGDYKGAVRYAEQALHLVVNRVRSDLESSSSSFFSGGTSSGTSSGISSGASSLTSPTQKTSSLTSPTQKTTQKADPNLAIESYILSNIPSLSSVRRKHHVTASHPDLFSLRTTSPIIPDCPRQAPQAIIGVDPISPSFPPHPLSVDASQLYLLVQGAVARWREREVGESFPQSPPLGFDISY